MLYFFLWTLRYTCFPCYVLCPDAVHKVGLDLLDPKLVEGAQN